MFYISFSVFCLLANTGICLENTPKTLSLIFLLRAFFRLIFSTKLLSSRLKVLCYLQSEKILQKATTCIRLQAKQIFFINIKYTYFSILGVTSVVSFLCYFQKSQLLVVKKFWTNFCCTVLLYLCAQKECLRIFFQTGDINIFVLRGVHMFN